MNTAETLRNVSIFFIFSPVKCLLLSSIISPSSILLSTFGTESFN